MLNAGEKPGVCFSDGGEGDAAVAQGGGYGGVDFGDVTEAARFCDEFPTGFQGVVGGL